MCKTWSQSESEAVCEGQGYNEPQCVALGCCEWDDQQCWAVGGVCMSPSAEGGTAPPTEGTMPCLDDYATRLGVTELPPTASAAYKALYCQYTSVVAPNGKPIEIFGQSQLSSLQLYRARSILEFYLADKPGSVYGSDKIAVANAMANNGAKLDMPNGAHEQPGAGQSLQGQELFWSETPVEGSAFYFDDGGEHRDAAFEEILHMVHDNGIGIDVEGYKTGALPDYQAEIRAATTIAQPTWLEPAGTGLWGENSNDWILELQEEGSLTQEYLASVIDVYYDLWSYWTGVTGEGGMWGIYVPKTRAEIQTVDPMGWALVQKFFHPYFTQMVMIDPTFEGTFSLSFNETLSYTWKSQHITHVTLLGTKNSNLEGNDRDNRLGPNAGNNTLDGVAGNDVAVFQGSCEEYMFSFTSSPATVKDTVDARDGTTYLRNIESVEFSNGVYPIDNVVCTLSAPPLLSAPPPSAAESLENNAPIHAGVGYWLCIYVFVTVVLLV